MYLTHLTFINDGNPNFRQFNKGKKLINFKKRSMYYQVIENIQLKQQKSYPFEVLDYLANILNNHIFIDIIDDDDKLWDISKKLE
jgi:hypothetical protein